MVNNIQQNGIKRKHSNKNHGKTAGLEYLELNYVF